MTKQRSKSRDGASAVVAERNGFVVTADDGDDGEAAYRTRFDPRKTTPSDAVVQVASAVRDVDPIALPSLYGAIETDALDALFGGESSRRTGRTTFPYAGFEFTVESDGVLTAVPVEN